jgi:hypothetical protein
VSRRVRDDFPDGRALMSAPFHMMTSGSEL